jgi:heat shock protein HslJ
MNIRRTILVGATLVLTVLLAACATAKPDQPPAQSAALLDTEWALVSLHGGTLIEGRTITLRFMEGSVEGSGGCNTYGGSYTASKESLSFGDVYRTEIGCTEPEGIMKQEQGYFEALNNVASYRVDGDRLELYDEAGTQILVFVAAG